MIRKVKDWIIKMGYNGVVFLGEWNSYNIYAPTHNKNSIYTGSPIYFLEDGEGVRYATQEETWEIFDTLLDIEDKKESMTNA